MYYRHALGATLLPSITAPAATTALRGIGAARAAATTGNGGPALLEAAKHAYTSMAGTSLLASAVITVVKAVLAVTVFKSQLSAERGLADPGPA